MMTSEVIMFWVIIFGQKSDHEMSPTPKISCREISLLASFVDM